jgi:hypothetical protein
MVKDKAKHIVSGVRTIMLVMLHSSNAVPKLKIENKVGGPTT